MPNAPVPAPSAESNSDEWSHVRETVNMLYLAVCQIEATLRDSNTSVETLTNSFTALANHTNEVSEHVQSVEKPAELDTFKRDISDTARELQSNISSSIHAFQFYDRVCQRLDHVCRSLENVTDLLECDKKLTSVNEWRQVQNQIKSSYTMEAERIMFEFIMRGGSVREALEIYSHHFELNSGKTDQDDDEVELF